MTPDIAAAVLRAFALCAMFQSVGGTVFQWRFCGELGPATGTIRRILYAAAVCGIAFSVAGGAVEAGRLTGEFSGLWDWELQRLAWGSRGGLVRLLQIAGLAIIVAGLRCPPRTAGIVGVAGVMVTMVSFAGAGHTSIHPLRVLLGPLLVVHVLVGALWFGALAPLIVVIHRESPDTALHILARFSAVAVWAVPGLGAAGIVMAALLAPGVSVLTRPYGELLALKTVTFCALLVFAAGNRWRIVPAMAGARVGTDRDASGLLRGSIAVEIALIAIALAATAVMTTWFSPES